MRQLTTIMIVAMLAGTASAEIAVAPFWGTDGAAGITVGRKAADRMSEYGLMYLEADDGSNQQAFGLYGARAFEVPGIRELIGGPDLITGLGVAGLYDEFLEKARFAPFAVGVLTPSENVSYIIGAKWTFVNGPPGSIDKDGAIYGSVQLVF